MDSKNLAIALLTVTAAILSVGLTLAIILAPSQTLAASQMDRSGDYVVATGQLQRTTEVVYITDAAIGRLNVYLYDRNRRQIDLLDGFDLTTQLRQRRTPTPTAPRR